MQDLLFLAQRIPYPPNKGDKIRSWNFLRRLAAQYRVHLGCFVDDAADLEHRAAVERVCASVAIRRLEPRRAKLHSLKGLLSGEPLTLPYFHDAELDRWVAETLARHDPAAVFVFSSAMAQYVRRSRIGERRLVIDMVDADSQKWRQYAARKPWPLSLVYARESRMLLGFERLAARESDATLFVSAAEAALFRDLAPETAGHVTHVENGVDCEFFAPDHAGADPFPAGTEAVVFTGMMDYWPNIDAVTWFAAEIWPRLREARPAARFVVVGANPVQAVQRLAEDPGIVVTGRVADVRPYIGHAGVVVAPLRVAQGIQNKVLEAMAMARPVIASPQALDGLAAEPGRHLELAADAASFAERAADILATGSAGMGEAARAHVRERYSWERNYAHLAAILAGAAPQETPASQPQRRQAAG